MLLSSKPPPTSLSAPERKDLSGLDRKDVSAKPSEDHPVEHNPSPLLPIDSVGQKEGLPTQVEQLDGSDEEPLSRGHGHGRELVALPAVLSFREFWLVAGRRGREGPARAEWRKLSAADKAAISDQLQRDGRLDLRDLWAATWLRDRVWEESALTSIELKVERTMIQHAEPGSELWRSERDRLRSCGNHRAVKLMDDLAGAGKGWSVRCEA